ncbi:MAG: hypothetical protein AAFW46_16305 [Pseudomonadota bacterium]
MTDAANTPTRRDALRRLACGSLLALPALSAAVATPARAQVDSIEDPFGPDLRGNAPLRLYLPNGGRYRPRRLVVLERQGPLTAELPYVADIEGVDRLPIAKLPKIGAAFGDIPAATFVRPEFELGPLYRRGEDAVVDLRNRPRSLGATTEQYLSRSIRILTRLARTGALELGLPGNLRFTPGGDARVEGLPRIGAAYAARDRLLLSPPYESLFGYRLF